MAADMEYSGVANLVFVFSVEIGNLTDVRGYLEPIIKDYVTEHGYQYIGWELRTDETYLDDSEAELVVTCDGLFNIDATMDLAEELADLIDSAGYVVSEFDCDLLLKE